MFSEEFKGTWLLKLRDGAGQLGNGLSLQPVQYPACRHQCYVQAGEKVGSVQDKEEQEGSKAWQLSSFHDLFNHSPLLLL